MVENETHSETGATAGSAGAAAGWKGFQAVSQPDSTPGTVPEVAEALRSNPRDPLRAFEAANRLYAERSPELMATKRRALTQSAHAFYRMTPYFYYTDIEHDARLSSAIEVPVMGDMHLENQGTYNIDESEVAVAVNDFDDALSGSFLWDVGRLSGSLQLAARDLGMKRKKRAALVESFTEEYLDHLERLLDHFDRTVEPLTSGKRLGGAMKKAMRRAEKASHTKFIKDLTTRDGQFENSRSFEPVAETLHEKIIAAITSMEPVPEGDRFAGNVLDTAFRIAGKASLGRLRYIVLVGEQGSKARDRKIYELKEAAQPSASLIYGATEGNQAHRVVQAALYFNPGTVEYLGTTTLDETDLFVREVTPYARKVELDTLEKPSQLKEHMKGTAVVLARAHARSGMAEAILDDVQSAKKLRGRIVDFAEENSSQVRRDFKICRDLLT